MIADVTVLRIQSREVPHGPRTDAEETEAAAAANVVVTVISAGGILSTRIFQRLLVGSLLVYQFFRLCIGAGILPPLFIMTAEDF